MQTGPAPDPLLNPSGRCRPHEQPHIAVPLPPTSWFARTNGSPQALEHRRWRLEVYLRCVALSVV